MESPTNTAGAMADDEQCPLPSAEALVAATLALMTAHAQASSEDERRFMNAAVIASLTQLSAHARFTFLFRTAMSSLVRHWEMVPAQRSAGPGMEALHAENAVLARELASAQQRSTRLADEQARRIEMRDGEIARLRSRLFGDDNAMAEMRREPLPVVDEMPASGETLAALDNRAVLCVGAHQGAVLAYRSLVERTGGRFLHHDESDDNSAARLDATLAAADLVICQAGCISHDAYWRVKDHCKRTGKRCVFIDTPSSAALQQALLKLAPVADETASSPLTGRAFTQTAGNATDSHL